jgi:uncharacterized membrane protein
MMWHHWGLAWFWMLPVFVLFWGAVIAVVVFAIRAMSGPRGRDDAALEILRRRLAAGEISPDDYEKARRLLQS